MFLNTIRSNPAKQREKQTPPSGGNNNYKREGEKEHNYIHFIDLINEGLNHLLRGKACPALWSVSNSVNFKVFLPLRHYTTAFSGFNDVRYNFQQSFFLRTWSLTYCTVSYTTIQYHNIIITKCQTTTPIITWF